MVSDTATTFDQTYEALMGFPPYPWQRRLYERMMAGNNWPAGLDIPTGLGKTSVMPVWLIALAHSGDVPRRLVYVVNRRTIVDQASDQAKRMLGLIIRSGERDAQPWATPEAIEALGLPDAPPLNTELCEAVAELRQALTVVAGDKTVAPLAVSTLRGQLADNSDWMRNPACSAIIVGTVDMIGSRLLFNAYRSTWKQQAMQAGLIGQDALIIHDEAHLTQPFQKLLTWVRERQEQHAKVQAGAMKSAGRAVKVLNMSATSPGGGRDADVHRLNDEDMGLEAVRQRLDAAKRLKLHSTERKDRIKRMVALAVEHERSASRVIVFVQSPADAGKVVAALKGKSHGIPSERVALLTGTIRGRERDALARNNPVLQALTDALNVSATHYLVSTSAGEVGADFDADHLVCDATTLDGLIQRLGRVNRRGGAGRVAKVDLVCDAKPPARLKDGTFDASVAKTVALLHTFETDTDGRSNVSPAALRTWVAERLLDADRRAATAPVPAWEAPHDAVLDAWAMTSVRGDWPLAHDVEPYLHGMSTGYDRPQTMVAWRAELDLLDRLGEEFESHPQTIEEQLDELFTAHRLRPHETLRITDSADLVDLLLQVRAHIRADADRERSRQGLFATQSHRGTTVHALAELEDDAAIRDKVQGAAAVILPPSFGGLNDNGMLEPSRACDAHGELDVADDPHYTSDRPRTRYLLLRDDEEDVWRIRRLMDDQPLNETFDKESTAREKVIELAEEDGHNMREAGNFLLARGVNGDPSCRLLLIGPRKVSQHDQKTPVLLREHVDEVVDHAKRFARAGLAARDARGVPRGSGASRQRQGSPDLAAGSLQPEQEQAAGQARPTRHEWHSACGLSARVRLTR